MKNKLLLHYHNNIVAPLSVNFQLCTDKAKSLTDLQEFVVVWYLWEEAIEWRHKGGEGHVATAAGSHQSHGAEWHTRCRDTDK